MKAGESRENQWQFYDRQSDKAKGRAFLRIQIINDVEALMACGMNKSNAIKAIAVVRNVGAASIWNWMGAVAGVHRQDRLAYLTPGFRGGGRKAIVDHTLFNALKADYLRPASPSWADCYRRAQAAALEQAVELPSSKTLWRKLNREMTKAAIAYLRAEDGKRCPANDR